MTVFWKPWGPLVKYANGTLTIEDLNPEISTTWVLSRWDRLRFGLRMAVTAFR